MIKDHPTNILIRGPSRRWRQELLALLLAGGCVNSLNGNGIGSGGSAGTGGLSGTGAAPGTGGAGTTGGTGGGATGGQTGTGGQGQIGGMGGAQSGGTGGALGGAGGVTPAFDRVAVTAIMRRVADAEIARFGAGNDNGWIRATFHTGMLAAYRALGDVRYRDYTMQWGQANAWQLKADGGGAACLGPTRTTCGPRFGDNQACVQSYAELYLADPGPQNDVMLAAAQTTFDTIIATPRIGRVEWWWEDALFMAPPALARVALATGKTQYLTLMHNLFWDTKAFLFDPAQNLFWRDSDYLNMNVYWSRGNGWVVAGIARILEVLPATDTRRPEYEALLRQMVTKLAAIQSSDGFWRSSLTQPTAFPNPESSGTAFFCFGIAWGINHGILDRATFLPTVTKAWAALGTVVSPQGRLGWVQAVGAAPNGTATADSTNDYATGAFLLAGSEILKL